MIRLAVALGLALLPAAFSASDRFPFEVRVTRLAGNPIISPRMLSTEDGDSINGPSLIRVPSWVAKPLGRYYLYFAHHAGKYIRMAYADRLEGPWKIRAGGVLQLKEQPALGGHIASPEAVVDDAAKRIVLYLHGKPAGVVAKATATPEGRDPEAGQQSIAAESSDGLHFRTINTIVGPAYLRVFRRGTDWYAINNRTLFRAPAPGRPFRPVAEVIGDDIAAAIDPVNRNEPGAKRDRPKSGPDRYSIRHVGIDVYGDWLAVYFSCVGHRPERILATAIEMKGDPATWRARGTAEILRPETEWEGAKLSLEYSQGGRSRALERQLRDPAVFAENGRRWLLYSVAGEHGLAIAELHYSPVVQADFVLQDALRRPEPFAQSRLQINPPTFRWPAVDSARAYEIELSRTASFDTPRRERVSDLFFRPLAPLDPGVWFWRYRVASSAVGKWSPVEFFAIEEALPRWPLPEWKRMLERIPASHPRLFVASRDLPAIRAAARRLDLQGWIRNALDRAAKPFDLAQYEAQVPAPGTGGFTPQQVKKKLIWASKAAGMAAGEPIADLAWLWLATQNAPPDNSGGVDLSPRSDGRSAGGGMARASGSLLQAARARALMAARLDPEGFVSESNSDFGNAAIVYHLGLAYDLLYDRLSAEERALIRRAIVVRARPIFENMANASQRLMRAHNWQHIYLDGLAGALAIHGEEPAARQWVELGLKSFLAFYPWYGGNDGGSHEGTKYYYGPEMIPSLLTRDLLLTAFGVDMAQGNPWFRNNAHYLIYSYPPASAKAKLGDSIPGPGEDEDEGTLAAGKGRLVASRLASLFGDGFAAAYAAALPQDTHGYTAGELLRWAVSPPPAPKPLTQLPSARLFADIGAVFTHSDYIRPEKNVRLVFHSSPYGGFGHGHADQNSFHVIAYDEDLLLDSGYYTPAGDPHREKWSVQTKAHNTILVDGEGQPYGNTSGHGRVRHFADNDQWTYMVGSAATAYKKAQLERFDRHIVWLKRAAVPTYVVFDDLRDAAGASHRFDWLLHAASRMGIDETARAVTVRGTRGEALVRFVEPARLQFQQDDQFDVPAVYWRKDKNYPLPNQWHLKATPPNGPQARIVAVIQVSPPGVAKPSIRAIDGGVEVEGWRMQLPDGSETVRIQNGDSR
jgi:hypothetical protein